MVHAVSVRPAFEGWREGSADGSRFRPGSVFFLGRPRRRRVDSRPSRFTIRLHHASLPYGCPRCTLRVKASISFLQYQRLRCLTDEPSRTQGN